VFVLDHIITACEDGTAGNRGLMAG